MISKSPVAAGDPVQGQLPCETGKDQTMSVASIMMRVLAFEGVLAGLLFTTAGRWQLPWFWALIAVHAATLLAGAATIDPDLWRERRRPGPGDRDRPYRVVLA